MVNMTVCKGGRWHKRYSSAKAIADALPSRFGCPSASTVRRDLKAMGFRSRVRPRVPTRIIADNKARLQFAKRYGSAGTSHFVFVDETWLTTNENTGRREWVVPGEEPFAVERKHKWNTSSVQVFAAIGYNYKSELVIMPTKRSEDGEMVAYRLNADRYIRTCLSKIVPHLVDKKRTLVQDGARCHDARRTMEYLARKHVRTAIEWPAYSPDLNPIEQLWAELKRKVGERCPTTMEQLIAAAKAVWAAIPMERINRYVKSFKNKLKRCLERRGLA